jgi:hypothetical protein
MSVDVDICNSALIKLGQERINALTDNKKTARLCQEQYPKIKERMLRDHKWNFAIKRASLTAVDAGLAFGSENTFNIPLDCLRILSIYDTGGTHYKHKVEGRYILADIDTVQLRYITEDIPEAYYDSYFKEALACALAADLCYAFTQSNTMKQALLQESEEAIAKARSFNSMEETPDSYIFDDWDDSRIQGRNLVPGVDY